MGGGSSGSVQPTASYDQFGLGQTANLNYGTQTPAWYQTPQFGQAIGSGLGDIGAGLSQGYQPQSLASSGSVLSQMQMPQAAPLSTLIPQTQSGETDLLEAIRRLLGI